MSKVMIYVFGKWCGSVNDLGGGLKEMGVATDSSHPLFPGRCVAIRHITVEANPVDLLVPLHPSNDRTNWERSRGAEKERLLTNGLNREPAPGLDSN